MNSASTTNAYQSLRATFSLAAKSEAPPPLYGGTEEVKVIFEALQEEKKRIFGVASTTNLKLEMRWPSREQLPTPSELPDYRPET